MRGSRVWAWLGAVIAVSACSFPPLPQSTDAATSAPDAEIACAAGTVVCDDAMDRYVECSSQGTVVFEMKCPLGCAESGVKCLDVDPSNGLAGSLDLSSSDDPDVVDIAFTGVSTIDTDTAGVTNNGVGITPETDVVGGIRVFVFDSLSIAGTLKVRGDLPLALVVNGDVLITGTLDVSADLNVSGPGMTPTTVDSCGGDTGSSGGGAGGGGRFNSGGDGGDDDDGSPGSDGGAVLVDVGIVPLRGGCIGGSAFVTTGSNNGKGGGAVQIVSRTEIHVAETGVIDASGGGGKSGNDHPGPGGGSGGAILLEAPQVLLDGAAVVLSTKGGGGAAACNTTEGNGADGGIGPGAAQGGSCSGQPDGGDGGTETAAPTNGGNATSSTQNGSGGGGSVGVTHFNTLAGTVTPLRGATIRSRVSNDQISTREVP